MPGTSRSDKLEGLLYALRELNGIQSILNRITKSGMNGNGHGNGGMDIEDEDGDGENAEENVVAAILGRLQTLIDEQ